MSLNRTDDETAANMTASAGATMSPAIARAPAIVQNSNAKIARIDPSRMTDIRRASAHLLIGRCPNARPPASEVSAKTASTKPASGLPSPNIDTTPASIAAKHPTTRMPTIVTSSTDGRASTTPNRRFD